jgi:NADH-quinone oxidoreductase subunit L
MLAFTASFFAAYYLSRLVLETFQRPIPFMWKQALPGSLPYPRFFSASLILGLLPSVMGVAVFLAVLWTAFTHILVPGDVQGLSTSNHLIRNPFDLQNFILPSLVAAAGWGLAIVVWPRSWLTPAWVTAARDRLYVFVMNRGYIDEVYDVFLIRPTLRTARWAWKVCDVLVIDGAYRSAVTFSLALSRWLWQVIDVRGIDRGVVGFGTLSLAVARWLWRVIDVRGIDRAVTDLGASSFKTARWLSKVDVRGIDRVADEVGRQSDATGQRLARLEPRTLQHHVLVMITWLVLGLAIFYLFAA